MVNRDATVLSARGIDKSFPGVQALTKVDFDLRRGEVHALVGENGAGKSTLTRILAGVESPDSGRMELTGRLYSPRSRTNAEAQGVRMVMQELNLIGTLSVAENIFIERLPSRLGFIRYRELNRAAGEVMREVGLGDVEPSTLVSTLGVGRQQMVEIAAGLSRRCRVLALDEPTASLTDSEVELLFSQIRRLQSEGVGLIYISHRIEEVLHVADRVTILRDGRTVGTHATKDVNAGDVIRMMVGRDLGHEHLAPSVGKRVPALRVVRLTRGQKVRGVSFEAYGGEILGIAGLMGSGRTETVRAIFGADRPDSGDVYLYGSDVPARIRKPSDAVRRGIALLTEDRKSQGLLLSLPIRANVSLTRLSAVSRLGWINRTREAAVAQRYAECLDIKCSSVEQLAEQLSGGNQQKVVIAKWLYRDCDILIFDEPTRGIDVGAKFEIYRMLSVLAGKGKAIVFVSSDLKELMLICNRIVVISAGRIAGEFQREHWSEEQIMTAAFSGYRRQ